MKLHRIYRSRSGITARLTLISATLLLASCTSVTTPSPTTASQITTAPGWQQRQQQLSTLTDWDLSGAIGIQQNNRRWSASISWQQHQASHYNIRLAGAFGAGATLLQGQSGRVTLVTNDHPQPVVSTDPESLIAKETGWQLPVSNLYYWIRSLPAPHATSKITLDALHRPISIQQAGWQIDYLDYTTLNGLDLPDKIRLSNNEFTIKLVIKQWVKG